MEIPRWMRGSRNLGASSTTSTSSIGIISGSTMRGDSNNNNRLRLEEDHDRLFGRRIMQNNDKNDRNEGDDEAEEVVDVQGDTDTTPEEQEEGMTEEEPAEEELDGQEPQSEGNNDEAVTSTQEGEVRIDLVRLVPFDVKLSLTSYDEETFNGFALTDILTDWMDESLTAQIRRMELGITHSQFDSVILEERSLQQLAPAAVAATAASINDDNTRRQRNLQQSQPVITVASYEGVTLWKHSSPDQEIVTPTLLEDIQRQVLLQDDRLLQLLQGSNAQGLGSAVNDVRAYINPNPTTTTFTSNPAQPNNVAPQKSNTNANLELIIVVAIVVACMAFAFLVFSLFWAWRFDQQRRDQAYRVETAHDGTSDKRKPKSPDGSGVTTDSDYGDNEGRSSPANMNVLVTPRTEDDDTALDYAASETNPTTGIYPESVISEDISTSLSAYYRSGMGSRPIYGSRALGNNDFNDQASFSSMESYGYSLDGYAPSLGGNTYANAVPPPSSAAPTEAADKAEKASP